uniref:Transmembrane protein n=1 Tax=Quercus lobata TaxID=97700 RepID=A0A7N2M426_QUELO
MGTREVYEEKLRSGNMYNHDPTINPGLGSPRCPRCLSLLNPNSAGGEWTITSVLHDATAVAGTGIGAMLSAVHGFNTGIPYLQNRVKGPKWLPFLVGLPPLLLFSGTSAAFGECEFKMKYFQSYLVLDALTGEIDKAYLKGIERYAF